MMSATKIAKEEKARTGEKAGEDDAMADEKSGLSGVPGKGKPAEGEEEEGEEEEDKEKKEKEEKEEEKENEKEEE